MMRSWCRCICHLCSMIPVAVESPRSFSAGSNVYLQQKSAFFRHTPQWLDKLLDSPALPRQAGRRAGMTNPRALGEMTLAIIEDEHGHQAKEVSKLVACWSSKSLA
jgi:hypothetical protein